LLPILGFLLLLLCVAAETTGADMEQNTDREGQHNDSPRWGTARNLLFIHHSCGGQLLADPGQDVGEDCIYTSHPNGGGLRRLLAQAGYAVHELSYNSRLGADTDIRHWRRKFTDHMTDLLRTDHQDRMYDDGQTNDIVVFKSCYPNNGFVAAGDPPGDPDSSQRTVANAKAAYRSLLPEFGKQPATLFVAFTAPPLVEPPPGGLLARFKAWLKGWLEDGNTSADLAREFNTWLADGQNGWLADYPESNVVVFDYYDILTDHGATDWAAYPSGNGCDSHPNQAGNQQAAGRFLELLQRSTIPMTTASR